MKDRIVYIHPDFESETTTVITPKDFDDLLEEGWRIKERKRQKVEGKMMDVVHLVKVEKNDNAVAVRQQPQQQRSMAVVPHQDNPGGSHSVAISKNQSFLGVSDFQGMPGLQVGTSMMIEHAYAMGVDAAHRGGSPADAPWPAGTIAGTQWLKGFAAGAKAQGHDSTPGGSTKDAYEAGKLAGKGDADLEVHCPYPRGTPHYDDWLRGFQETGGKVL